MVNFLKAYVRTINEGKIMDDQKEELKDLFDLIANADNLFQAGNTEFLNLAEQILTSLRASGVIPIRRVSDNNYIHLLCAGTILGAWLSGSDIWMSSRRTNEYVSRGVSTKLISWFDAMVKEGFLVSEGRTFKAEGRLKLGQPLLHFISNASLNYIDKIDTAMLKQSHTKPEPVAVH
jgi:hypothetical protein